RPRPHRAAASAAIARVSQPVDAVSPSARRRETGGPNRRTIGGVGKGQSMRILLAAQAGLFADAFGGSLAKLASHVEVERCDPEQLQEPDAQARFAIVLIDADAAPGRAAALVHRCRERLPDMPVVALGSGLDESLIAGILNAGAQAYLPKSYREVQALGVLQVVLDGPNHGPHADGAYVAPRPEVSPFTSGERPSRRSGPNPYGLTDR